MQHNIALLVLFCIFGCALASCSASYLDANHGNTCIAPCGM